MLAQNSDNQQQNSISKSNQLFKENSNNKETTVSFTKSINEIHIETLKRKINSIIQYQKPYISKLFYEILAKNFGSEFRNTIYIFITSINIKSPRSSLVSITKELSFKSLGSKCNLLPSSNSFVVTAIKREPLVERHLLASII